jgi:hypothetical protein
MSDIFVERKPNGKYAAIQNKHVIATGSTQAEAGPRAHPAKPEDPVLAERVRNTSGGSRDKWRRMY